MVLYFFLVSYSPCLRTTITTRMALFPKKTLRKLQQAFPFPFVSWTKKSGCLMGHTHSLSARLSLQSGGSKSGISRNENSNRKHKIAAGRTRKPPLNTHRKTSRGDVTVFNNTQHNARLFGTGDTWVGVDMSKSEQIILMSFQSQLCISVICLNLCDVFVLVKGRTCEQRGDHGLFHAG